MRRASFAAGVLALTLAASHQARACGPAITTCWFTPRPHPDLPLSRFAAGELGVLQPTWARSYRIVAYRHLSGAGMDRDEQAAAVAAWEERLAGPIGAGKDPLGDAIATWKKARAQVPDVADAKEPGRVRPDPETWSSAANCLADAFVTAARTLDARIAESPAGARAPEVHDWTSAQDEVFAWCGGAGAIPDALSPEASARDRADRNYQRAAALMYAGRSGEAAAAFEATASDASSAWAPSGRYLAARTLARQALWSTPFDPGALAKAERALKTVVADPAEAAFRDAAQRLLDRCRFHSEPAARLGELCDSLALGHSRTLRQDLLDATLLIDAAMGSDEAPVAVGAPRLEPLRAASDLLDWTMTWEDAPERRGAHALARWKATRSLPWLIASLELASPAGADASAVLGAADSVTRRSPGWLTTVHGQARLLASAGRLEEARSRLDAALAEPAGAGARNVLLAARLPLSTSPDEWWRMAERQPEGCASWAAPLALPDDWQPTGARPAPPSASSSLPVTGGLVDIDGAPHWF